MEWLRPNESNTDWFRRITRSEIQGEVSLTGLPQGILKNGFYPHMVAKPSAKHNKHGGTSIDRIVYSNRIEPNEAQGDWHAGCIPKSGLTDSTKSQWGHWCRLLIGLCFDQSPRCYAKNIKQV